MSDQREGGITWTDVTWNPIRGCSRVSEGCRNCYAERTAFRYSAPGMAYEGLVRVNHVGIRQPQWNGEVRVVDEHMFDPLRWRRPRRIFVNSMSDLFHENVSDETIDRIFAVMAFCPQHTFQVLTKRPERMLEYLSPPDRVLPVWMRMGGDWPLRDGCAEPAWPLPNVWLGVSVENQAAADERIPLLLQTPAAVRWISAEPLLGPIDLTKIALPAYDPLLGTAHACTVDALSYRCDGARGLGWAVVGGESGPGARPMHPDWARSLRDQCVAGGVAFHFKQWGEWVNQLPPNHAVPESSVGPERVLWLSPMGSMAKVGFGSGSMVRPGNLMVRIGKKAAGRLLDGREWNEYPAQAEKEIHG